MIWPIGAGLDASWSATSMPGAWIAIVGGCLLGEPDFQRTAPECGATIDEFVGLFRADGADRKPAIKTSNLNAVLLQVASVAIRSVG